jgi:hypothetical protein
MKKNHEGKKFCERCGTFESAMRRTKTSTGCPIRVCKCGAEYYLSSAEIGEESRRIMFGENGEAWPDDAEWSAWVD